MLALPRIPSWKAKAANRPRNGWLVVIADRSGSQRIPSAINSERSEQIQRSAEGGTRTLTPEGTGT
jgi:hypothetical protein